MVTILSPAKSLNFEAVQNDVPYTQPLFPNEAEILIEKLKTYSKNQLISLLNISDKLADLNYHRYKDWKKEFNPEFAKQAVLAFHGEVFNGLRANELDIDTLNYAQDHLLILSGLHGVLRPLDLIRPYRLEMGTRLTLQGKKGLYNFWGNKIHDYIAQQVKKQAEKTVINLASQEYAKAAKIEELDCKIITPVFKELRGDTYKQITIYFKKARGLMARFILNNRIESAGELKLFDLDGYAFHGQLSSNTEWVFTR